MSRSLPCWRCLTIVAVASLLSHSGLAHADDGDRVEGPTHAVRSETIAPHAMVATSQPLATEAALGVLRDGGSAVDAAIAANAMLGLVEPTGSGIGGDLFAIVWDAEEQQLYGLNASGRSPKSLTREAFGDAETIPAHGPLPVTVPGAVDGWFVLHAKFGKLRMSKILAPAIERAEEGFPLSEVVAYYWGKNADVLSGFENFASTFLVDGRAPRKGEVFRNPDLAKTYRTLATDGRDAFYEGALAETMDAYMERLGGFLDADDLRAHRSTWVRPVTTNYRGYDVWELPPNGQGIAALSLLNLLEGYDVAAMGYDSPQFIHTFVEAKKLVFADRAKYYADPGFAEVPVNELVSKSYADDRRKLIGGRAAKAVDPGNPALAHGDTVYLTVADEAGNMVSLIQSNYRGMGSGLVPDGLGFVFQDRGQLFDLKPGRANSYAPGKRPFHTIIPAFVSKDGKAWMSFGVMGGPVQPQMHAQVLINIIDFGMGIQEAGDAARFVHAGSGQPTGEVMGDGGVVLVESGVSRATVRALQRKGHKVETRAGGYGGYQAIAVDAAQGVYIGASESRKDGYAAGY